jgi:hypothetical protein
MYENGKVRSVETIPEMNPGMRGEVIKENDGGGDLTIIYYKNFVNVTRYP